MPTQEQLDEMDQFMNTTPHDDYDYDWLCPHEVMGCDECWGDGWLEDYDKENYGDNGEFLYSEHSPEERTGGKGINGRFTSFSSNIMGEEERRDPFVLLPLERLYGGTWEERQARLHGRRRLSKLDSGR